MSKDAMKVAELIREIAGTDAYEVYQGFVREINADLTAEVEIDANITLSGVRLSVLRGDVFGMLMTPRVGAACVVAQIERGTDYQMVHASQYDRVQVRTGNITLEMNNDGLFINEGNNGGMVKVQELTERLNGLENQVNDILNTLQATVIPLAPSGAYPLVTDFGTLSPLTPTQRAQIENTEANH